MGGQEAVLERFIDFEREVSMIGARGANGWIAHYGLIENTHRDHILDTSVIPAGRARARRARGDGDRARAARALDVVGVLCVEFFLTPRRRAADQRARAAAAQLRAPDDRRLRHQPVRAAGAGGLRPAARLDRAAAAGRDGQPARRPVGGAASRTGPPRACVPGVKLHLYGKPSRGRAGRWAT